jgi:hypothetical protein
MTEEKKPVDPQAPAQEKPVEEQKPPQEKPPAEEQKAKGLDGYSEDELRDFYKRSPGMFKKVADEIKAEQKPVAEKPKSNDPPQSAAPAGKVAKYQDKDIKLPDDVNDGAVQPYFDHWKEMGFSPEQVQREVDFMSGQAKAAQQKPRPQKTAAELASEEDARNVAALKADPEFGKDFKGSMEIARRAYLKHGSPEMQARMTTSDPVLVKHFYELGKLDTEDRTPERGRPRTGDEKDPQRKDPRSSEALKGRYNHPTSQGMFKE